MSLETWKAEFYPVPASEVPVEQAAAHSLKKWEGLRPESLDKHKLFVRQGYVVDEHEGWKKVLRIDADSCALCVHHKHETTVRMDGRPVMSCAGCPLYAFPRMIRTEVFDLWFDAKVVNPPGVDYGIPGKTRVRLLKPKR